MYPQFLSGPKKNYAINSSTVNENEEWSKNVIPCVCYMINGPEWDE